MEFYHLEPYQGATRTVVGGAGVAEIICSDLDALAAALPADMLAARQWLTWSVYWNTKRQKFLKPARYAGGKLRGDVGTADDRAALATFAEASAAVRRNPRLFGVGFAPLPDGFAATFLDLDDKDGRGLRADALALARTTYHERSPGGRGVRAVFLGRLPGAADKMNGDRVEVFTGTGYVTLTGVPA